MLCELANSEHILLKLLKIWPLSQHLAPTGLVGWWGMKFATWKEAKLGKLTPIWTFVGVRQML